MKKTDGSPDPDRRRMEKNGAHRKKTAGRRVVSVKGAETEPRKAGKAMGKGLRRGGAALCAGVMILAASCARAEFSPRYGALMNGPAVALEIGGRIEQKDGMADASLSAVNDWLSCLTAKITLNADGAACRMEASMGDERLLAVTCCPEDGGTSTFFEPAGHVYLTAPGRPDALSLMTGMADSLPDPLCWARAYRHAAPELFRVLAQGRRSGRSRRKLPSSTPYRRRLTKCTFSRTAR